MNYRDDLLYGNYKSNSADDSITQNIFRFASQDNREKTDRSFAQRVYSDSGSAVKTFASDFKYIYSAPARINKKYALWLGGILTTGGLIMVYDDEIFDAFQRNKNHKFYKPIRKAGEKFEPVGLMAEFEKYYFSALVIGYITGIDKLVEISSDFLKSYGIASPGKISANIIFGRRRPREGYDSRSYKFYDGTSLPSGHSSNIVQMATVLSHHIDFLPFKMVAYGIATTVCLERITSNDHWPSDVYFGALYGRIVSKTLLKRSENRRLKITPLTMPDENNPGIQLTYRF